MEKDLQFNTRDYDKTKIAPKKGIGALPIGSPGWIRALWDTLQRYILKLTVKVGGLETNNLIVNNKIDFGVSGSPIYEIDGQKYRLVIDPDGVMVTETVDE